MNPRRPPVAAQRGITLIEALTAFLVLTLGMLAVVRMQPVLRQQADIARQRAEAVRLAQEDLEQLRGFVTRAAAGTPSFEAIASARRTVDANGLGSPRYELVRNVDAAAIGDLRQVAVTVSWVARDGSAQQVALASMIAGIDPALGGVLALRR